MQKYNKISITKDQVVSTAQNMRENGVTLAMIHAFIDDDGMPVVSYEYEDGPVINSYTVTGEKTLPTISHIYDKAAEWPEREIMELLDIVFEGVDTSVRLFIPESMLDENGQILITPMNELLKRKEEHT